MHGASHTTRDRRGHRSPEGNRMGPLLGSGLAGQRPFRLCREPTPVRRRQDQSGHQGTGDQRPSDIGEASHATSV